MKIEEMKNAVKSCADALTGAMDDWARYRALAAEAGIATPSLPTPSDAMRICAETLDALTKRAAERARRFDAVPVLQATLRFKDGSTRKVAVSKPNCDFDEPYIGEMFYHALQTQGMAASLEEWPILVVDRRRRVVATIAPIGKM